MTGDQDVPIWLLSSQNVSWMMQTASAMLLLPSPKLILHLMQPCEWAPHETTHLHGLKGHQRGFCLESFPK